MFKTLLFVLIVLSSNVGITKEVTPFSKGVSYVTNLDRISPRKAMSSFKAETYVVVPWGGSPFAFCNLNQTPAEAFADFQKVFFNSSVFNYDQEDVGFVYVKMSETVTHGNPALWAEGIAYGLNENGNKILKDYVQKTQSEGLKPNGFEFKKPTKVMHHVDLEFERAGDPVFTRPFRAIVNVDDVEADALYEEFNKAAYGPNPKVEMVQFLKKYFTPSDIDEMIQTLPQGVDTMLLVAHPIYVVDVSRTINRWYRGWNASYKCTSTGSCF